jgi:hypothetical protein
LQITTSIANDAKTTISRSLFLLSIAIVGGRGSMVDVEEAAVSTEEQNNIREINNSCYKRKHISIIITHLLSILFALSAASYRLQRMWEMPVGGDAVWLMAGEMFVNVREIIYAGQSDTYLFCWNSAR